MVSDGVVPRKMRKKASPRNADMPVFFLRTYCPFCRTNHEWFAKQAWVREGSPAAERKADRRGGQGAPKKPVTEARRRLTKTLGGKSCE